MPQCVAEQTSSTPENPVWTDSLNSDLCEAFSVRAGQTIPIGARAGDTSFYILLSGLCIVECSAGEARRRILAVICPGDIIQLAALPELPSTRLVATRDCDVLKLTTRNLAKAVRTDPHLFAAITDQLAKSARRSFFLLNALGGLKAEARVASLFIELALRLKSKPGEQSGFQMPLSRKDLADHLALNADTLSRIFSRLKTDGICHQMGRDKIFIKNWPALLELCPISNAILEGNQ